MAYWRVLRNKTTKRVVEAMSHSAKPPPAINIQTSDPLLEIIEFQAPADLEMGTSFSVEVVNNIAITTREEADPVDPSIKRRQDKIAAVAKVKAQLNLTDNETTLLFGA